MPQKNLLVLNLAKKVPRKIYNRNCIYNINKAAAPTTAAIPNPTTLFCPAPAVMIGVLDGNEKEGEEEAGDGGTPVASTLTRPYVFV